MTFSVLFWNVWLDNEINGEHNSGKLLKELKRLIDAHKPDYIGLNEVLQDKNSSQPFILDFLKTCGYKYGFFALASPLNDDWLIGAGFCSRTKPLSIKAVPISKDTPAERRGCKGFELKAIVAQMELNKGNSISIVVAHPMHLRPYTIKDHYQGTKTLENLVRKELPKNALVVGDFNEPGFMPKAFKNSVNDIMHMRTGTIRNATWHHKANPKTLIRANLDQLYWSKDSNYELKSFEVINSDVSDHRPILARFAYK